MHQIYSDIMNLTKSPPNWYDENGVPRYCYFHPRRLGYAYAREAALARIQCQGCHTEFKVAFSELNLKDELWDSTQQKQVAFLSDLIVNRSLHYGDPPNIYCCSAGPTMNSIPIDVLEYWVKPYIKIYKVGDSIKDRSLMEWKRDQSFELPIDRD